MSPGEVAAIMFGTFILLMILKVPVAFSLGLACLGLHVDEVYADFKTFHPIRKKPAKPLETFTG